MFCCDVLRCHVGVHFVKTLLVPGSATHNTLRITGVLYTVCTPYSSLSRTDTFNSCGRTVLYEVSALNVHLSCKCCRGHRLGEYDLSCCRGELFEDGDGQSVSGRTLINLNGRLMHELSHARVHCDSLVLGVDSPTCLLASFMKRRRSRCVRPGKHQHKWVAASSSLTRVMCKTPSEPVGSVTIRKEEAPGRVTKCVCGCVSSWHSRLYIAARMAYMHHVFTYLESLTLLAHLRRVAVAEVYRMVQSAASKALALLLLAAVMAQMYGVEAGELLLQPAADPRVHNWECWGKRPRSSGSRGMSMLSTWHAAASDIQRSGASLYCWPICIAAACVLVLHGSTLPEPSSAVCQRSLLCAHTGLYALFSPHRIVLLQAQDTGAPLTRPSPPGSTREVPGPTLPRWTAA